MMGKSIALKSFLESPTSDFNNPEPIKFIPPLPLETLPEQLPENFLKFKIPDYLVAFSGQSNVFCVGVVDMVNSTKISAHLSPVKVSMYYEIFLNTMARVLNRFGGMIIKNGGDSLLFYFPESSKGRPFGFMACLEGCLAMIDSHDFICECAKDAHLPEIDYRISCDYGPVMIMKNSTNSSIDMIGTPMNISFKINRLAAKNQFVIGGDLYEVSKKFSDYNFISRGHYDGDQRFNYPVFSVLRK